VRVSVLVKMRANTIIDMYYDDGEDDIKINRR
jgi:hypothetical protein